MNTDIERLLAEAADDSDQPLRTSVEDIVARGRSSVRKRRVAAVSAAAITAAVIVGSVAAWPTHQAEPEPANITIETNSGKTITPPPPVSPLSHAVILQRCLPLDREWNDSMAERGGNQADKAGPLGATWKLGLKTGTGDTFFAIFLSPDRTIAANCTLFGPSMYTDESSYGRISLAETKQDPPRRPADQFQGPANLRRVFADGPGNTLREGLVGTDGIFTFGVARSGPGLTRVQARGYDEAGNRVMEQEVTVSGR